MRFEDIGAAKCHRQRQRTAGQTLGVTSDIGRHVSLFAGEARSRAAPACHHFVGDQQNAMNFAYPFHLGEHPSRIDQHAAGAEDQRLNDQRRNRCITTSRRYRIQCRLLAAGRGKGNPLNIEQQRGVGCIEDTSFADRHAADRIAVIGAFQRQDATAPLAAVPPEAERHFQRDFDRGRAAIGEKDVFEPRRRHRDELPRELFSRVVGEAGKDDLIETIGLIS